MISRKTLFIGCFAVLTPTIIYSVVSLFRLDLMVTEKFANRSFLRPTQFYATSLELRIGETLKGADLLSLLEKYNYRQRSWGSVLQESDYSTGQGNECAEVYQESVNCFAFHHHLEKQIHIVGTDAEENIVILLKADPNTRQNKSLLQLALFPQLYAQYLGSKPVIQNHVPLGQIPRQCLDAALAIEDTDFLEHQGVSYRGLLRAMWVNLKSFKWAQGGSTITQQLVKNDFLTAEKSLSRKFRELFLAWIVEARVPKDQILETYLNIIYLGQQGNFQIRGYPAAARFYFQKEIEDLQLSECALLGAIINSPGRFNPFRSPENALARRTKVLEAMLETGRILKEDFEVATKAPLPKKSEVEIRETAPYFIEGVVRQLHDQGFNDLSGYKIYTTLDLRAQAMAQKAVQNELNQLESNSEYHQKNKKHSLQAVFLASDVQTGAVLALVGGRDHRQTPFNRVFEGHRQVGSVFKPLVYLTAFYESEDFSPWSLLENSKYQLKYEGQTWEPHNYDNSTSEKVPAFYALKESLNIPTARLAMDVGLNKIIRVAQDLGVKSPMKPFPALSLGAFEMTPFEVLQVYTNIARRGATLPLRLIKRVENELAEVIYTPESEGPQILNPQDYITLTSILQEGLRTGTGQGVRRRGFEAEAAGKTGTTSNYKDAWFAGFTSQQVGIAWIGYDDNTPVKLSGASGALPIWTEYMKAYFSSQSSPPFSWDLEDLEIKEWNPEELMELGIPENKALSTSLIYYKK